MFTLYISTIYDDPYAIEVEVIGVVRQKYTMLQSITSITLLQNDPTVQLTILDQMVRVTCALVNLLESNISLQTFYTLSVDHQNKGIVWLIK